VAAAMMQGKTVPRVCKHDVSIFFANIVGYNSLRGAMDPATLIDMLERLFSRFDRLAKVHGVERVDVIDGCYIAAANFSADQASDHAVRLARFALDAVVAAGATALDEQRLELGSVQILAGMHCGVVCGSVVGAHGGRKYTLHGDAVNVASRMESHGTAGAVQCSAASAARIEEQGGCDGAGLRLAPRDGGVDVKGRGHMSAFWLSCAPRRASCCPLGPTCVR
jgi:guanylate cyclase